MSIKSFPYPVLGNEDDIEGKFSFGLHYTLEPERVILEGSFLLIHPTIDSLIEEGRARFVIEVVCGATFYREVFDFESRAFSRSILASNLRGTVSVSSFICAASDIDDYDPVNVHPDLAGEPSKITAGEVIAIGPVGRFVAEKSFDPFNAPVSSFMRIHEGTFRTGAVSVIHETDKILIELSKDDYAAYSKLPRSRVSAVLHASVVLPVLTDTMHLMKASRSSHQDQQWFARIEQIIDAQGLSVDEPFETAQKILAYPLSRSFRNLKEILEVSE